MSFSHLKNNKDVKMVDISKKKTTIREAHANAIIKFSSKTFKKIILDDSPKGSIFNTAVIAGTLAAKKTHELIPLCHHINLSSVSIDFKINKKNSSVEVISIVKSIYKTGVEMEALTSCSIACLTIYDMCKSFDKEIIINNVRLTYKSGGKSGEYRNDKIYKSS
jgi:cyclic pyranopterin phosphate synthase